MRSLNPNLKTTFKNQQTLKKEVSFSGIGVHTGVTVSLKFCPAKEGSGIYFKRVDLPTQPIIPATLEYVQDTARSTTIGIGNVRIHTVEHVLAAVKAMNIDNLCIEVSGIEPPVGNGSSDVFVDIIEEAGIEVQDAKIPVITIDEPIYWSEKDIHLVALPSDCYKISYTLNYPNNEILKAQYHTNEITPENFKRDIAPCRTFSLYEEISVLLDRGLIKGGSLENAVVVKDEAVLSKNGLFFPDEMVRHKVLDMVGDLSLVGFNFYAHIISIRSGHPSNYALAKKIFNYITLEKG